MPALLSARKNVCNLAKKLFGMRILFPALLVAFCFGCATSKKVAQEPVTTIFHGKSFGRCAGYCTWEQTYTADEMISSKTSHRADQYPEVKVVHAFTETDMKRLLEDFDLEKFKKLPEKIGCPDCADGGSEYIEITTAGMKKRVTFENGKAPYGFENFVVALTQEYEKYKKELE